MSDRSKSLPSAIEANGSGNSGNSIRLPFLDALINAAAVSRILRTTPEAGDPAALYGLAGAMKGLLAGIYAERSGKPVAVICGDSETARDVWNDALLVLPEKQVGFFGEYVGGKRHAPGIPDDRSAESADVLRAISERNGGLIIADAASAFSKLPGKRELLRNVVRVEEMQSLPPESLAARLSLGGYERNEFVGATGEFALRGGILDVFPVGFGSPLRIEFYGDIVESIREFDPLSQRSIGKLESTSFLTSLYFEDTTQDAPQSLLDHLSNDTVLFLVDAEVIENEAESRGFQEDLKTAYEIFSTFRIPAVKSMRTGSSDGGGLPQPACNGSVAILRKVLDEWEDKGIKAWIAADSVRQARRLEDLLADGGGEDDPVPAEWIVIHCPVSSGFVLPDAGFGVITEHQVFNRRRIQKNTRKGLRGMSLRELRQLKQGDYVVHVDKGIGKFLGLQTINVNGGLQETAKLLYANDDILYVNLAWINRLQKYSSEEGAAPALSRLGTGEWERLKEKTRRRLKDIARDLIQLYARRAAAQGFSFSQDTQWQKEMEASFLYEDTPDQHQATQDVKKDMEALRPMDRLVCGDVGYGKTEVAVRAAFKAVLDGKQVAVLAPTTILAQQHLNTFQDRLLRYSVQMESLSRFKTKAEQKELLSRLREGGVDIIIGTHRLLSEDVEFRDLGLLIIDEEHRFGVTAKEKLKRKREHVDTISLTATPIPRTLNFSLLGARDLSVIETPPPNRLPIETEIIPFDKDVIAEAINRELERGGQVYFVTDRIGDLEKLAGGVRSTVASARIGIAHGRMTGSELERVMLRFMEKRIDVLVTTKIIESGLDIPNANTIIINRADRFGLAELYQLRGRVGRSNIQAYAYLIVPPPAKLSRDALKRLQAVEEFTELGSGFHLALRDMEIRGAGNLLGAEQSGFIADIGFELYLSTIEDAVGELKSEEFSELFAGQPVATQRASPDVLMELGLDAYLPQSYVEHSAERFDLYKRLYSAGSDNEVSAIADEISDRFGRMPSEAEQLLHVIRLRLLASRIRLAGVKLQTPLLLLTMPPESDNTFFEIHFPALVRWIMSEKDRMKLEQDAQRLTLSIRGIETQEQLEAVLREIAGICSNAAAESGTASEAT